VNHRPREYHMPSLQGIVFYWMLRLAKGRSPLLKSNLTLQEQRAQFEEQSQRFNTLPSGVALQPVNVGELDAEWLRTPDATSNQAILFLHGGLTMGSCASSRGLAALIALSVRVPILSLNYRLAPDHPFPTSVEDTIAAYRWLIAQGVQPQHISVV